MARIATMCAMLAEYSGPDALYKINYTLKYKVTDPKEFFKYLNNIQNILPVKLNDELRIYADQGNALVLVKIIDRMPLLFLK